VPRVPKRPTTAAGRAFEAAFESAISVVVGILGGYYADRYFGTGYLFFFIGFVLGGVAAVRRLLQIPVPEVPGSDKDSTDRAEPSTVRRGDSHADRGADEPGDPEPGE